MEKNEVRMRKNSLPHVRRLKSVKRQSEKGEKLGRKEEIVLESVLGVTVSGSSSLATSASVPGGLVAYPAGCVIVLHSLASRSQRHLINDDRKTITCLALSSDGAHLVTGEMGHRPRVKVWSVSSLVMTATLSGHKFGVSCVDFTPNNQFIVSVGAEHDMTVYVWDWKNNRQLASNKISFHVRSISISPDGSYFVTVGNRHVKFWYVNSSKMKGRGIVPLTGRSGLLGDQRNNYFLDVAFGKGDMASTIFAITKSGLLCQLNSERLLEKWVELKVKGASTLCVGQSYILVGCTEGIIRCFSTASLGYVTSLPRPDLASVPDVTAMSYDETHSSLTVVYSDHSLITWDVGLVTNVSMISSHNFHSSCVWSVDTFQGGLESGSCLVTSSNDDTIRLWSLDFGPLSHSGLECHLQKTISVDPEPEEDPQKTGVKIVRVSPDENFIASGDRNGNIRVHDTRSFDEICKIEAHDAEVTSLKFAGDRYLASASRDRLVHLFDAYNNFQFLTTVDEHSSCVTSVDFLTSSGEDILVSSGADRSIISRKVVTDAEGGVTLSRCQHIICKTVPYDMMIGSGESNGHIFAACQDRAVRVFSSNSPKSKPKIMKGSSSDDGSLFRMTLDRSGSYYAASCSDKTIGVYNYQTGDLISTLCGHSEIVTGLVFSYDCQHLVSVSGDSCIFVWRLPRKMSQTMASKLNITLTEESLCTTTSEMADSEEFGSPTQDFLDMARPSPSPDAAYRFSVGKLPVWARKKVTKEGQEMPPSSRELGGIPRGKWASSQVQGEGEEDVLKRFQEDDDEPDLGSVDKTKKLLFQAEEPDHEEFQVNAIDADTLKKSQKELRLPQGADLDLSLTDPDVEEKLLTPMKSCVASLDFLGESENIAKKATSISNAWREGMTPVQQRRNAVSIGKLLATNQLQSLLKNDTPEKSPLMPKSKDQDDRCLKVDTLLKPSLVVTNKDLDKGCEGSTDHKTGILTKSLIKEVVNQVKTSTDQLLVLFKRVSLDDALDDNLRQDLMLMMSEGAGESLHTLRLVQTPGQTSEIISDSDSEERAALKRFSSADPRSKEEIRDAALENIQRFLSKNVRSDELENASTPKKI